MTLLAVGVSHRTAAVAIREKAALSAGAEAHMLASLLQDPAIDEAVALSTCNRTELYAAVRSARAGARALSSALVRHTRLGFAELSRSRYLLEGDHALEHLLRVSAGLDSMVLGESEIQGQVRKALARAQEAGAAGPAMRALFRRALVTGKRVRRSTGLARGPVSVPRAAVDAAVRAAAGLGERRAVVLGAGRAAGATASALVSRGVEELVVLNRSRAAAEALALRVGGRAADLDALEPELAGADIVICSTGSPAPLLSPDAVERALAGRPTRPIVVIDLAVPRDVEPDVRSVAGAVLFDLDDLELVVRASERDRVREAWRAERIVREEAARYHRRSAPAAVAQPFSLAPSPCAA